MSADFFDAPEQKNFRAPFSGEDLFDVTPSGRLRPDPTNLRTCGIHGDAVRAKSRRRPHRGRCPSTWMRAYMLICASIIAQPIKSQGIKKSTSTTMQGNYASFAQSVVAIVDFF